MMGTTLNPWEWIATVSKKESNKKQPPIWQWWLNVRCYFTLCRPSRRSPEDPPRSCKFSVPLGRYVSSCLAQITPDRTNCEFACSADVKVDTHTGFTTLTAMTSLVQPILFCETYVYHHPYTMVLTLFLLCCTFVKGYLGSACSCP